MADKVSVVLPDGSKKEYSAGMAISQILRDFNQALAKGALATFLNGRMVDLSEKVQEDSEIKIINFDSEEGKEIFWHSTSHVMAQAVQDLFPGVKLAIGPPIKGGFYYDFDTQKSFEPEDLARIELRMKEIVKQNHPFKRRELAKSEAEEIFRQKGENYKLEILSELEEDRVVLYQHDDFVDLCRGPHVPATGVIKNFKLLSIAGAYWKGSEKNPMLQRIYGISFATKDELDQYLKRMEEMKRRDHRVVGKELELFSISDEVGPGLVLWHPKGAMIRRIIEDFWVEEHQKHGYQLIYTPHVARLHLWERSGHTGFYQEYMYSPMQVEDEHYQLKPMNCPFHILIYKSKLRSYRDLPLKLAELGACYRYERSGVLQGLFRVRGFTMDDAHIFCKREQLEEEVIKLLDFSLSMLKTLSFEKYQIFLSTRPDKSIGEEKNWEKAQDALRLALEKQELEFEVDEGGGAFYGPKIDLKIEDVMGRPHQCTTIQFDFNIPERFDLSFVDSDGNFHRPIMIHRALLGSLERFFGVLIEHYGGAFPLWLSPVQVRVMPITDEQNSYSAEIESRLKEEGFRVERDDRNEKINYKIRKAEKEKIPYMFIVGKKEVQDKNVSVRRHKKGDLGRFDLDEIIQKLKEEVKNKTVQPVAI
ncbi:MAG: threonyl-tRNA synthetase [candidate division Zixibacteria bacterium SM23_73_3]|nr:MAG: threonyl-tRNA synthetase [candidate division Zixibacteria bacterium SM23_73_3]